ncbi:MAG: glucuronate isomerase [Bacteroidota bacterium]
MKTISSSNGQHTQSAPFLGDNFLLENKYAQQLYHDYAQQLPIIDYHNHLPPEQIATNHRFDNLTQVWLYGDHYKWRAMRTNGINERQITGEASDEEKFLAWAKTVPYTLRNPLYHWTHLELERYFGVDERLDAKNANAIYQHCNEQLQRPSHHVHGLLTQMKVETLCTTDDPVDDLAWHQALQGHPELRVLPTFRPDKAILIEQEGFLTYLQKLSAVSGRNIQDWDELLTALTERMDFFQQLGCCVADHGLEYVPMAEIDETKAAAILSERRMGKTLSTQDIHTYQATLLHQLGIRYHQRNWVMQLHLGALRNNNRRLLDQLGPDTGFDSIGDFTQARGLSNLLNRLDSTDQLPKTILYNLNPRDNEVFATMTGNFNDGSTPGKVQYGSAWWFLDQLDGMEKQLNTLSQMGLLSRFIGMLTDSRSFLSFPRHEYFRRLLCQLLGDDIQRGRLPADLPWIGQVVQDICYYNAQRYFNFVNDKNQ